MQFPNNSRCRIWADILQQADVPWLGRSWQILESELIRRPLDPGVHGLDFREAWVVHIRSYTSGHTDIDRDGSYNHHPRTCSPDLIYERVFTTKNCLKWAASQIWGLIVEALHVLNPSNSHVLQGPLRLKGSKPSLAPWLNLSPCLTHCQGSMGFLGWDWLTSWPFNFLVLWFSFLSFAMGLQHNICMFVQNLYNEHACNDELFWESCLALQSTVVLTISDYFSHQ